MGLNEEGIKSIRSSIYYQFDMKTEEEAGEYYDAFSQIFRVLQEKTD